MEGEYDPAKARESFEESAKLAEWFYRSHVQEGLRDTNAATRRDELLARVAVYEHLRQGEFLASRDALLAELRWLLKYERPLTPRNAFNPQTFARYRGKLLQSLLERYDTAPGEPGEAPRRANG